jgi:uncharacterized SAM-binding protein YcdF (DUF218 family)
MKLSRFILTATGAALLLNGIAAAWISHFSVGVILTFIFGAVFTLYGIFLPRIKRLIALHVIAGAITALTALGIIGLMIYGISGAPDYNEDAVIVLGAGVRGETVSYTLQRRLNAAAEYYSRNPNAVICVTGGQGAGEHITEAEAMSRYLLNAGIPPERIIKEDKATNTYENLMFSKIILDARFPDGWSAVTVTNNFHCFRAELLANKIGFNPSHIGTPTYAVLIVPSYLRELCGIAAAVFGLFNTSA